MKKKFLLLLFITIVTTSLILTFLIGEFSRYTIFNILEKDKDSIIEQIKIKINQYHSILHSLELEIEEVYFDKIVKMHQEIISSNSIKEITNNRLKFYRNKYKVDHIYLLDRDKNVYRSTKEEDLGLNFNNYGEELSNFIENIYGVGEVYSHQLSFATKSNNLNKYIYYSPKNSDYIIEISIDIDNYIKNNTSKNFYDFLYNQFFNDILFSDDSVIDIDIYSIRKNILQNISFINREKELDLDYQEISEIENNGSKLIKNSYVYSYYENYTFAPYNKKLLSNYILEVKYDFSIIVKYRYSIFIVSIFAMIIISIIIFLVSSRQYQKSFIEKVEMINTHLINLRKKNYEKSIIINSNDEFETIGRNINNMVNDIKNSNQELQVKNSEIEQLHKYYYNIIEFMPSGIIITDKDGYILEYNNYAKTIFTKNNEISKNMNISKIDDQFFPIINIIEAIDIRNLDKTYKLNLNIGNKNYAVSIYALKQNIYWNIVIRFDDITYINNSEKKLRIAQKMELVGNISSGLSHDFNNILGAILGSASLLKIQNQDTNLDLISTIEKAGYRARDIVQELLSFSKKQEIDYKYIDLIECLESVVDICLHSFDKSIKIEFIDDKKEKIIYGDYTQLQQVFLNICINAYHAMTIMREESDIIGGKLSIKSEIIKSSIRLKTKLKDLSKMNNLKMNKEYCMIEFSDNGVGISKRNLEKIFDPFYTTKKSGTGLGLSMVMNIIQKVDGVIDLESKEGKGTKISIYLPLQIDKSIVKSKSIDIKELYKGKGNILLLEPEDIIAEIIEKMLLELGFSVLCFKSVNELIDYLKRNNNDFKFILMSEVNGFIEIAVNNIKSIIPDAKILLMTNSLDIVSLTNILRIGITDYISKPFKIEELSKKIHNLKL